MMNKKVILVILILFAVKSYGQDKCDLIIKNDIEKKFISDSLLMFKNEEMNMVVGKFNNSLTDKKYQVLYYRNSPDVTLTYLEIDSADAVIINNKGFRIKYDNYNINKLKIENSLADLKLSSSSSTYEQSCPRNHYPEEIIELLWIKKEGEIKFVYHGDKESVNSMKDSVVVKNLKQILNIIFYKWYY